MEILLFSLESTRPAVGAARHKCRGYKLRCTSFAFRWLRHGSLESKRPRGAYEPRSWQRSALDSSARSAPAVTVSGPAVDIMIRPASSATKRASKSRPRPKHRLAARAARQPMGCGVADRHRTRAKSPLRPGSDGWRPLGQLSSPSPLASVSYTTLASVYSRHL